MQEIIDTLKVHVKSRSCLNATKNVINRDMVTRVDDS